MKQPRGPHVPATGPDIEEGPNTWTNPETPGSGQQAQESGASGEGATAPAPEVVAPVPDVRALLGLDRTEPPASCTICAAPVELYQQHTSRGPETWAECRRCGTLHGPGSRLREEFARDVAAMEPGGTVTIAGPFRSGQDRETVAAAEPQGDYLLDRSGAFLLARSFGLTYVSTHTNSAGTAYTFRRKG